MSSRMRIIRKRLKRLFPSLKAKNFRVASRKTVFYNCIAWAAGVSNRWWEWTRGYPWPNAPRSESLAAAIKLFENQGFEKTGDPIWEPGWMRVAIYGKEIDDPRDGKVWAYTHAAKQLDAEWWSSKIGTLQDIKHRFLQDLECEDYGRPMQIMRKRILLPTAPDQPAPPPPP